jgi:acetate kinase
VPARVLVVNAGSSSLKYQVLDPQTSESLAAGAVERIGGDAAVRHTTAEGTQTDSVACADHTEAFAVLREQFERHGPDLAGAGIAAVGHRVVHGGEEFSGPVVLDDDVIATVLELAALAPLHNPANVQGVEGARAVFTDLPHVAVFDTAFHATIPPAAREYAVPARWREEYGVRKYGFHGTSHAYGSRSCWDVPPVRSAASCSTSATVPRRARWPAGSAWTPRWGCPPPTGWSWAPAPATSTRPSQGTWLGWRGCRSRTSARPSTRTADFWE